MTEPKTLTRRSVLVLAGTGAASAVLAACSTDSATPTSADPAPATGGSGESSANPSCVLTPEAIEGPFYTDVNLVRRDITDGKPGSPLALVITVVDAETCEPIPDATVDIWHADAGGLYSSFPNQGDEQNIDTSSTSFLRGVQPTDNAGIANFDTIYPGWYPGRTTHLHMKVHLNDNTRVTTQLYLPDDISDAVYREEAYAERGPKDTSNGEDGFGGDDSSLLMTVEEAGNGRRATHVVGISRR